ARLVEDLVPLHGLADVLDVVEPAEVATRNVELLIVEAGGDDEPVERDRPGALDREGAAVEVDSVDPGLVRDVDASIDVRLLVGEEQPLEAVDLTPVDVWDAAGAVSDVFELGVDPDIRVTIGGASGTGSSDTGGAPADHHDPCGHWPSRRTSMRAQRASRHSLS